MINLFFQGVAGVDVVKNRLSPFKLLKYCLFYFLIYLPGFASATILNEPDSVYLFAHNANGLRFSWSTDQKNWTSIGDGYVYLRSDYGRWGSEKKMNAPHVIRGRNGEWVCVWQLNSYTNQFAAATSKNLINWSPQSYPYLSLGKNVLRPVVSYDQQTDTYNITYTDADGKYYRTSTKDFNKYQLAQEVKSEAYRNYTVTQEINGKTEGQVHRVPWSVVAQLKKHYDLQQYRNKLNSETTKDDATRFANLKAVDVTLVAQFDQAKPISTMLTGVFFEDINYAADGGLYAELIQNRDFEYKLSDKSYNDKNWNSTYAWSLKGNQTALTIDSINGIHINNPHYAVLKVENPGISLVNSGFDGISTKKNESYQFSTFAKVLQGKNISVTVSLVSAKQGVVAQKKLTVSSATWKAIKTTLISSADAKDVSLEITVNTTCHLALDMISLFPEKTFKGRQNGLRSDLATTIANIKPRFVRFPGGCVAHGDGIDNIYKWKNSIGPLESRKPDRNLWGYHQTMGLGYFEYFQFCEDIGAEPVPVVAAGVPCQNSGTGGGGQQGGIPMAEMAQIRSGYC